MLGNICVGVDCGGSGSEARGPRPTTFFYDESRFLLTSVDLPVVSQVVEACWFSEKLRREEVAEGEIPPWRAGIFKA
jgi:hypothetical protein